MIGERLFHIIGVTEWKAARAAGLYTPSSLTSEGFVHFSYAGQVAETAGRHYHGRTDLIVLEVDPALLGSPVVVEDSYGTGQRFPHVYGPVPLSAVVGEHPLSHFL